MTGKQLYKTFKGMFPDISEHVYKWVDKGGKQIVLICDNHKDYIFTVNKDRFTLEGRV